MIFLHIFKYTNNILRIITSFSVFQQNKIHHECSFKKYCRSIQESSMTNSMKIEMLKHTSLLWTLHIFRTLRVWGILLLSYLWTYYSTDLTCPSKASNRRQQQHCFSVDYSPNQRPLWMMVKLRCSDGNRSSIGPCAVVTKRNYSQYITFN